MKIKLMTTQNTANSQNAPITIHNVAIANFVGTAEFTRYEDGGLNHLGVRRESTDVLATVSQVPVTTLDTFAQETEFSNILVLKIDIEGGDFDALRGAENLLREGRIKSIFIETPLDAEDREELNNFLVDHGFSTAYIVRNSSELTPVTEANYAEPQRAPLNILAVCTELAHRLGIGK